MALFPPRTTKLSGALVPSKSAKDTFMGMDVDEIANSMRAAGRSDADVSRTIAEIYKQHLETRIMATHSHSVHDALRQSLSIEDMAFRHRMICDRLRTQMLPWKNFYTCVEGELVYVVVVKPAGPVTLQDAAVEFPSDALMASLRLLID